MIRIPSVNTIVAYAHVERPKARLIRRLMEAVYSGDVDALNPPEWIDRRHHLHSIAQRASRALELIDDVLETHGVESIKATNAQWSSYWHNTVASYCNTGESYAGTILYDTYREVFYVTSWADFMEGAERTRRYKFQ